MGKSGSYPDVSSECAQSDPLHKLSYLILLVHGYIFGATKKYYNCRVSPQSPPVQ
jgi:hypothetical protein